MARKIFYTSQIEIQADADRVFALIADFDSYHRWNPWLVSAGGRCEVGEIVEAQVVLGRRVMTVQHRVLEVVPGRRLKWCDMGWFTRFAYGERCRSIEVVAAGTVLYRNELPITGPLARLADWFTGSAVRRGMLAENQALKRAAEAA